MDQGKRDELLSLKGEILGEIVPLVERSDFDPMQKFELLLSSARISNEPSRYRAAYETLKQIDDSATRVNGTLDLLDAIEVATNGSDNVSSSRADSGTEGIIPQSEGE